MWLNAISTFGTFWLVACWLACSSWLFTFGLLPEKAGKELHVPGVNLGAWPEENMSHLCSSVQQKNMSVMSCKIRWFVSLLTSGGFNFWSWKEPKLEKTVYTRLSSLQSTHWATGCCRDPVSWMLSGGAWRFPAPPHPPLITNNNQILLFACST